MEFLRSWLSYFPHKPVTRERAELLWFFLVNDRYGFWREGAD